MDESPTDSHPAIPAVTRLVTFLVPCYNSSAYMDACITSILACGTDGVEVIVVDDGSTKDDTAARADCWQERFPDVIRAIHQPNGGHGAAVMRGVAEARGLYFVVVDSDDTLDAAAGRSLLSTLRHFSAWGGADAEAPPDLLVSNYLYVHVADATQRTMSYEKVLPAGRVFAWDEIGRFGPSAYMLMHALTFRTQVLRDCGLALPRHTFYVDVIYAYVPLPWCTRLFYLDETPYRYLVGREGQSVEERVMVGLLDDQLRVNRAVIDAYRLEADVGSVPLRRYMVGYLAMDMVISTVFCYLAGTDEAEAKKEEVWAHLRERDPWAWTAVRRTFVGRWVCAPGRLGRRMTVRGYELVRGVFKFN